MMRTKIMIVEDDVLVRAMMTHELKAMGYWIVAEVSEGQEAVDAARELEPDVILMDIELADEVDGIEAMNQILSLQNIPVIYLTKVQEPKHLRRASKTHPIAYLIKPFQKEQADVAIQMAMLKNEKPQEVKKKSTQEWVTDDNTVFIRDQYRYLKMKAEDIYYVEADRRYCYIHHTGGKLTLTVSLKGFIGATTLPKFIRIHRSYYVNINHITDFSLDSVNVQGTLLPIGFTYRKEMKARFPVLS